MWKLSHGRGFAVRNDHPVLDEEKSDDARIRRSSAESDIEDTIVIKHRIKRTQSILALAVSKAAIFAGTQAGEILKWNHITYSLIGNVVAHSGAVLCLCLSSDERLLFSSAGDAIVQVLSTKSLQAIYSIYSTYDVGDIFSVVYSSYLQTVYLGAQNTSIQWCDLTDVDSRPPPNPSLHPSKRVHRFFDSKGPGGSSTPRPVSTEDRLEGRRLEINNQHIKQYAHNGYVYCMLLASDVLADRYAADEVLISGGGDGTVKLWKLGQEPSGAITELAMLDNADLSVLSVATDGMLLFCGLTEGEIHIWDLDTQQLVRTVKAENHDILALSTAPNCLLSGAANGVIKRYHKGQYQSKSEWKAHNGLVLASTLAKVDDNWLYFTGGNDASIAIWEMGGASSDRNTSDKTSHNEIIQALTEFVSYRTVSCAPHHYAEQCRRGATYLRTLFKRYGAVTQLINTSDSSNPIVLAKFRGNPADQSSKRRLLFYGHYDVVDAVGAKSKWITDPFKAECINGYIYGRGVTDNKGPIIAALYAVAELVNEQNLESDIVFLIEGEEECGSRGLEEAVKKNKHLIGDFDWILVANSYWIDDDVPCLTYGLRGAIHATVTVESDYPDLHSGVDGSTLIDEPLQDLVAILAKLKGPHGHIKIPGFYEAIPELSDTERQHYDAISEKLLEHNPQLNKHDLVTSLMKRWREPTLTVHRLKTSGPEERAIIPRLASASISLRLVPNQNLYKIRKDLQDYLYSKFKSLDTENKVNVEIDQEAEPWLGDPENAIFQSLENAIIKAWGLGQSSANSQPTLSPASADRNSLSGKKSGFPTSYNLTRGANQPSRNASPARLKVESQKPLYIREGGSIGGIRFLEKEFNAPAAHLPCGQASDKAHLDNERLRIVNLLNSKAIFKEVFGALPEPSAVT